MVNELKIFLENENIAFEQNVSLKTKTWIKRGGATKLWIQPDCKNKLLIIIKYLFSNRIYFEIIGNTSNCYFTATYNPDITVSTLRVCDFNVFNNVILCGCGYNLIKLSRFCVENGISGYEGFIGIPGTVGGAAINNSGARGSVISQVVSRVEIINPDGKTIWLLNSQLGYKHRYSHLKSSKIEGVVLSVEFDIRRKDDKDVMLKKATSYINYRKANQENRYLNLGSIFSELDLFKNKRSLRPRIYFLLRNKIKILRVSKVRKFEKYLLFYLYGKFSLANHVSDKDINCFIWRNDNLSDNLFFSYIDFLKRISNKAILEIDIKDDRT